MIQHRDAEYYEYRVRWGKEPQSRIGGIVVMLPYRVNIVTVGLYIAAKSNPLAICLSSHLNIVLSINEKRMIIWVFLILVKYV